MKIAVPDLVSNSYFPAIAAVELGFFEREGLDISLEHIFPVTTCLELMKEGDLDFVAGTAHAVPQIFPEWDGAKLLAALAQKMYWLLILRRDLGAGRNEIEAVKGLRIGAAPMVEQGLRGLLAEAGIDPERDKVTIMPVPGSNEPGVSFGLQAAKALESGSIDGFWANALGSECAVLSGAGTVVADVRRGDGPVRCRNFTFPALVTSERLIQSSPEAVSAAVRAITGVQESLKRDVGQATVVGQKLFPEYEAGLIAEVVSRDLPYYDPSIPPELVNAVQSFVVSLGKASGPIEYEQAVAAQFRHLWSN
jgi:ABC-type nitrate/sulfonate/bicarbonate transport system substrate-binding protein